MICTTVEELQRGEPTGGFSVDRSPVSLETVAISTAEETGTSRCDQKTERALGRDKKKKRGAPCFLGREWGNKKWGNYFEDRGEQLQMFGVFFDSLKGEGSNFSLTRRSLRAPHHKTNSESVRSFSSSLNVFSF